MRRGTTPTLQITVTGLTDIEVQNLYLTLRQGQTTIEKTESGVTIDGLTTTSYQVAAGYTTGGTVTLSDDIETALAAI